MRVFQDTGFLRFTTKSWLETWANKTVLSKVARDKLAETMVGVFFVQNIISRVGSKSLANISFIRLNWIEKLNAIRKIQAEATTR